MSIFNYWVSRHPQLTPTIWGILSGRGTTRHWSEELHRLRRDRTDRLRPLSDWHRNVGLRLDYWRMTLPTTAKAQLCEALQYSPAKFQKVIDGQHPLLLIDLEHLSEVTGIPLSEWMPAELQRFFAPPAAPDPGPTRAQPGPL